MVYFICQYQANLSEITVLISYNRRYQTPTKYYNILLVNSKHLIIHHHHLCANSVISFYKNITITFEQEECRCFMYR